MPGDNNLPFGDNGEADGLDSEAEELRQRIAKIHKKFTGEDPEPATNDEILQFLRVINYNFISLAQLLQAILLKTAEMDTTLMNVELGQARVSKRLNQFFEANSMLDTIDTLEEGELDVSGSAPGDKFIF